ncbi:MAG: hypothetical protein K2M17_01750, partial [Bacilli bacterium]|nr:hypothetical protein [Bacilli bacterium]
SFGVYIYYFAELSMKGLRMMQLEYVLLGEFFALGSVVSMFYTIFKVDGMLFSTKDYDMLMALPIKKTTIIGSKMINLYLSNLFFSFIIMIPVLLVFTKYVIVTSVFYVLYICSIFVIPLLPTLIAVGIGTLVSFFASKFRFKKTLQLILMVLLVIGGFYFSYVSSNVTEFQVANFGETLVTMFNRLYPLTKTYLLLLLETDVTSIILFFAIPTIMYFLTTILIGLIYTNLVTKLGAKEINKKYDLSHSHRNSPVQAMLKKEFTRYISSPNYVINSSVGILFMVIIGVALFFVSPSKLESIIGLQGIETLLINNGPLLVGFLLLFSCTTSSSISLEGKNLWIIQSLPIDEDVIFGGKILLNFLLLLFPGLFLSMSMMFVFHLSGLQLCLFVLTVVIYAFFISILGLIINLHFPLLKWETEIKVIKQSVASFLTVFVGFAVGLLPFFLKTNLSSEIYTLVIDAFLMLLIGGMLVYLKTVGRRLFRRL